MVGVNVWMVRHGATDWSEAGRFTGLTDVPLNETGRAQARDLVGNLEHLSGATIWSSPLKRAIETARLAVGEPAIDDRLVELDFGSLEGVTWDDLSAEAQDELLDFDSFAAPDGESVADLGHRIDSWLADLPEGDHIAFTHGGVIRLLLRRTGSDVAVAPCQVVKLAAESLSPHNR